MTHHRKLVERPVKALPCDKLVHGAFEARSSYLEVGTATAFTPTGHSLSAQSICKACCRKGNVNIDDGSWRYADLRAGIGSREAFAERGTLSHSPQPARSGDRCLRWEESKRQVAGARGDLQPGAVRLLAMLQ